MDRRARWRARSLVLVALGVVALASGVCLGVFFAVGGPFGAINDVGNAATGVLAAVLALLVSSQASWTTWLAVLGAALTIVGSYLVMSDTTGYFLAGLWSSTGFALAGTWLVAHERRGLGAVAGAVMMLGFLGTAGIPMGVDDQDSAPWWTWVAGVGWLGTYLLLPIWALRTAMRPQEVPADA